MRRTGGRRERGTGWGGFRGEEKVGMGCVMDGRWDVDLEGEGVERNAAGYQCDV